MAKIKLPPQNTDLQRYVRNRYTKLFSVWGIWAAILTVVEINYLFEYFTVRLNMLSSILIALILYILPFFLMKGHRLFSDPSWEGVVTDIVYDRLVKASGGNTRKITYRYEATFTIDCGGDFTFYTLPCTDASMRYVYKIGDRLRKYHGLMYPIFVEIPEGLNQICPVCGHDVEENLKECLQCGHSRIDL